LKRRHLLEKGIVVGRIFLSPAAPQDRPWMWASGHNGDIRHAAHAYEPTREAAIAAFAELASGDERRLPYNSGTRAIGLQSIPVAERAGDAPAFR